MCAHASDDGENKTHRLVVETLHTKRGQCVVMSSSIVERSGGGDLFAKRRVLWQFVFFKGKADRVCVCARLFKVVPTLSWV